MRRSPVAEFIEKDNILCGIRFNSDFVAEHEEGIQAIKDKLKLDETKIGIEKRIINHFLNIGKIENIYFITTVTDEEHINQYLNSYKGSDNFTKAMWDKNNFLFFTTEEKKAQELFPKLAGQKPTALLTSRGISLLLLDFIPEDEINSLKEIDKETIIVHNLEKEDGLKDLLRKRNQEWRELYGTSSAPWEFIALSPRLGLTGLTYWLNPGNQQHINYGWYKKKDILQFLDGKGPIPKSQDHFKHLQMLTKIDRNYCISHYRIKHYNRYPRKNRDWRDPKKNIIEAVKKGELTKKAIKDIEISIKGLAYEFPRFNSDYSGPLEPGNPESFRRLNEYLNDHIKTEVQRRSIFTHLAAYCDLGLCNYEGYSNTPEIRTNINWWSDLLDDELRFETITNSGVFTNEEVEWFLNFSKQL